MELREAVARASCKAEDANWDAWDFGQTPSGEDPEDMRAYYLDGADVAIKAIQDAGYVIVPREPTEDMIYRFVSRALRVSINGEGGWSEYGRNQYKAMIEAFPTANPSS